MTDNQQNFSQKIRQNIQEVLSELGFEALPENEYNSLFLNLEQSFLRQWGNFLLDQLSVDEVRVYVDLISAKELDYKKINKFFIKSNKKLVSQLTFQLAEFKKSALESFS